MRNLLLSTLFFASNIHFSLAQSGKCLSLAETKTCEPFKTGEISTTAFSNISAFDANIISNQDTNPSYIADFKTRFACPNYSGLGQRYHISIYCGLFVDTAFATNCSSKETRPMLCTSVAQAAYNALENLFNDPKICTQTPNEAREILLTNYATYVNRTIENKAPTCVAGLQRELATCGFFTAAEANSYCGSNSADPCCKLLGTSTTQTIIDNPNLASNVQPPKSSGSDSNIGVIIGASIGGVILLFVIVFLAIRYIKNKKMGADLDAFSNGGANEEAIQIAETYEVVYNYVPNLSDEVYLNVGDKIMIKVKFDDGWALGYNMTTKQEGSFPLACVAPYTGETRPQTAYSSVYNRESAKYSHRTSSLIIPK